MTLETEARLDALEAAIRAIVRGWPDEARAGLLDAMRSDLGNNPVRSEIIDRLANDMLDRGEVPAVAIAVIMRRPVPALV